MDIFRRPRQLDPVSLGFLALAGVAGYGASEIMGSQQRSAEKKQQAAIDAANKQAQDALKNAPQVDDTSAAKAARLGRAALISTSPLGVQTTDPSGRRKLLGN